MLCAVWCSLYNFKNVKNTTGRMLLLVKLQASTCNFTKSKIPPWVFFTFFALYKWCKTAQSVSYVTRYDLCKSTRYVYAKP